MSRRIFALLVVALLVLGGAVQAQDAPAADALRVIEGLPGNSVEAFPVDGVITVIFNRPVVPLTAVEASDTLPDPLRIDPPVRGVGEWLNSAIYTFRAEPALAANTTYTITLNPDLRAVDGAQAEPMDWRFTTTAPAITEMLPQRDPLARLDSSVQITFNMPMDRASTEANFYLREMNGDGRIPGRFEWNEDSTGLRYIPDALLAMATTYEYGVAGDAQAAAGGALGNGSLMMFFETVPPPGIVRTDPFDGQSDAQLYGVTIYFASPMNPASLEDKITIEPEPWREPDTYYGDWDNTYVLSFPVEPSTDYTITLAAGAEDVYGNRLDQPFTFNFTTLPFDPDVQLEAPIGVGFYNAANAQTALYLTHRNVSQVDLSLYRVSPADALPLFVGENSYDPTYTYTPDTDTLLRTWSIQSVAPLNARRYELLDLGAVVSGAVECAGAPASRLQVGDRARVISTPDPVRARATPGDGEIVTLLYRDYALTITGGPECIDGILWWQVALRDGQTAWIAEGLPGEYFVEPASGATTPAPLASETGALPPGIYFLQASTPETANVGYEPLKHFMVVGTANLTLKTSIDSALVWATDVNTGEPIVGAPIALYDENYTLIAQGMTDGDGLMTVVLPRAETLFNARMAVLDDGTHFGIGTNTWSAGIESYDYGMPLETAPEPFRAYVYTDRPIYRPGQPVYFRGVVRARDDVQYSLPNLSEIPVQIFGGDDGALLYEATLLVTPFGTFSGQFDLADDAPLGFYRLVANLPRENADEEYFGIEGTIGFSVAQYRLPEFQVNVTAQTPEVAPGDTINVLVDSRFFFGGAVSDADVQYSVVAQPYFFSPDGLSNFSFIDFNYDMGASEQFGVSGGEIATGEGTTDASGQFMISLPAELRDAGQSLTYTVEATVTDESGQAVSGRADVIVNPAQVYVGVRPQEYVATVGVETAVDLTVVDWEGEVVADREVEVEVVERRWSSVQQEDDAGRTTWSWEVEDIPVTSGTVRTEANGAAVYSFTPPAGGVYKVIARTRDDAGNTAIASVNLWVSSENFIAWRQQNSNRIDLISDQDEYAIGDTAEILIASPFQGSAEALVTVERGDVLFSERVTLTGNSTVYRLPITADYAPNVYVSVFIVKGVDETNPVAAFRMGMIALSVERTQREITLELTPDRDEAGPGDTVTYTVRATDYTGAPLQAEVGIGLTDLASLSIAPPNSGSILDYYYGVQSLGVRTASALTINVDQLTQEILDTIKGGGGGFGEGGIFDIREEFVDTAFWDGALVTDANGEATFSVTLPDNLTTWRLDARAVTRGDDGDTLVGQETLDLISTKPLLIRPVTPRFFVTGDQAVVAAVVNNNTDQELTVNVDLEIGSPAQGESRSPLDRTITLAAGERQRVEWPILVGDADGISLLFFAAATNADMLDASAPPLAGEDGELPIYRYDAPETVATAGTLAAGENVTETISIPPELGATSAEAQISVQPSLVAAALRGLEVSELSPNPSTEEVISGFLPNLMLNRVLLAAGIDNPALATSARANFERGLQILVATQRVDGGWGWYSSEASDPATTAYAYLGLIVARDDGYTLDDRFLQRTEVYLRSQLITPSMEVEAWQLNRQAFILYALARGSVFDDARMATLYESRDRMSLWSQALLAQAFALRDPADPRARNLLDAVLSQAITSATGVNWEEQERDALNWNTDTRTTAIILGVLLEQRPESALVPNIVRWLVSARTSDVWETSQETSWALMAIARYIAVTGDVGLTAQAAVDAATVTVDGSAQALRVEGDAAVASVPAPTNAPSLIAIANDGTGTLYYTAQLDLTLPAANYGALNQGIVVERRYTVGDGEDVRDVTSAAVGETVTVRLTIIAPNDLHYVVIEDPIPAGAEAVNPDLATSQQIGTRPDLDRRDPLSQGWGWWWFGSIQFRDEKVVLNASFLPAGVYEFVYTLRPGLPGTYQVLPATAREAYFTEVFGRSAGALFTIESGE
jgi:alpha-2-macroglobulin